VGNNEVDMPPNSSRDPKVDSKAKQWKKKRVGARSLTHNTVGLGGHVGTKSQMKVQNKVNLHSQEKKVVSAS